MENQEIDSYSARIQQIVIECESLHTQIVNSCIQLVSGKFLELGRIVGETQTDVTLRIAATIPNLRIQISDLESSCARIVSEVEKTCLWDHRHIDQSISDGLVFKSKSDEIIRTAVGYLVPILIKSGYSINTAPRSDWGKTVNTAGRNEGWYFRGSNLVTSTSEIDSQISQYQNLIKEARELNRKITLIKRENERELAKKLWQ